MMLHQSDKLRFIELHKKVLPIPSDERSFLKLEGIFLDVISFARNRDEDVELRQLLYNLRQIKKSEYQLTQEKYSKAKPRQIAIKNLKGLLQGRCLRI